MLASCQKEAEKQPVETIEETNDSTNDSCQEDSFFFPKTAQTGIPMAAFFDGLSPEDLNSLERFYPSENANPPLHSFNGRLELLDESDGVMELLERVWWVPEEMGASTLPPVELSYVSCGAAIIPTQRGRIQTTDPYWDIFAQPGIAWSDPEDGDFSRALLPFSIVFKAENCVQNGLMTFLYNTEEISEVRYQVSQETCPYLQFNLYGDSTAIFHQEEVENAETIRESWLEEKQAQEEIFLLTQLEEEFQDFDVEALKGGFSAEDITVIGIAFEDRLYLDGCGTRFGEAPFCDQMLLPSYSLAKTLHLGLGMALMANELEIDPYSVRFSSLFPEEASAGEGDWSEVTLEHLVDMATGHYRVADQQDDAMDDFYTDFTLESRIQAALLFPYQEPAGERVVYLTPNSQLAAAAMDRILEREGVNPSDSFDLLVDRVFRPLGVTEDSFTPLRTWENGVQNSGTAFGGYGMYLTPQNLVKIARFMNGDGSFNGNQILHPLRWAETMFRVDGEAGAPMYFGDWLYNNGMWGYPLTEYGCDTVVPILFGISGNTVLFAPNGAIYFAFTDSELFPISNVLWELNKLAPLCGSKAKFDENQ